MFPIPGLHSTPKLVEAPCRPGQRRQHTKCRRRHHHRPQLHRMTALRAPKADHSEDPPEQVTPRAPARLSRRVSRQSPPDRRRSLLCLRWRRSNARPKPRTRRENTVIVNLVRPRRWHQRHQSFHQLQPAELQRRRPIAPCALQLNSNPAIWQRLEREPAVFFSAELHTRVKPTATATHKVHFGLCACGTPMQQVTLHVQRRNSCTPPRPQQPPDQLRGIDPVAPCGRRLRGLPQPFLHARREDRSFWGRSP